ncbi:hypothetical protein [Halosolutus halophilus]|uniref:hypothetical protein n=1 Tax=Halosolutus halophilus TaxID=1552990 RepID=UPI002234F9EB|nr:hypothetical protein [Halosolutus halophilus]
MVEDRVTDGRRIGELLASELDGRDDGVLDRIAVVNADRDVEPTVDGARAYDVAVTRVEDEPDTETEERLARVFVHDDRTHLEFEAGQDVAVEAAEAVDLRVRPKATEPPKTLVFVESGAAVKRASDVVQTVTRSIDGRE